MGSVNFVVVVESAKSLIETKNDDLKKIHLMSFIAVGLALGAVSPLTTVRQLIPLDRCQVYTVSILLCPAQKI
jgi:hypothetical protein